MKSELFFILFFVGFSCFSQLPEGFIDVEKVIPDITVELRYHTSNNFVGRPIDGYQANTLILTKEAAYALQQVQEETGITVPGLVYDNNPDRLEASYGTLIPILVKAIQDLSEKVTTLEIELNKLKSSI